MKLRRAGFFTKVVILALILYAGISLVTLKGQLSRAQETRDQLQSAVNEKAQVNAELQYEIEHSEDKETIEDIVRNKLGLVKPGEKIFFDVSN